MNFRVVLGLVVFSCALNVNAHHGFAAHFDPDKPIRIEGTVKEFAFVNPHSLLLIDTFDEAGNPIVYTCDMQARTQMTRHGYDETLFTVGESIVVEGYQGRRDPFLCEFGIATYADGSQFMLRTMEGARSQFASNVEIPVESTSDLSIFGNWIREGMYGDESGRGANSGQDSITEAGKMAVAAFDPVADNPVAHCRGGSPVRNWGSAGLTSAIYEEDGNVFIHHESMDIVRQIHMNMSEHPANTEPSEMGHSIGRWEGDELVIDSAYFAAGVISGSVLRTDQMTMRERLAVQSESGRLLISWIIDEPVYYSEPLTGSQLLQSTSQEVLSYECASRLQDYQ